MDAIVETRVFEYHGESRNDLYYTSRCCSRTVIGTRQKLRLIAKPIRNIANGYYTMDFKTFVFTLDGAGGGEHARRDSA